MNDGSHKELLTLLRNDLDDLGSVGLLEGFGLDRPALTAAQLAGIADQAYELLAGFYVHLEAKRMLYAVDPLARLNALRNHVRGLTGPEDQPPEEDWFHDELGEIFTSLRDAHTNYLRPDPYRGHIAFLPFLVEEYEEEDEDTHERRRVYVLTKAFRPFVEKGWLPDPGSGGDGPPEVTLWNGMRIDRAVALSATLNPGGNADARRARGLNRLTFRWLGIGPVPDEDAVTITCTAGEFRLPWFVLGVHERWQAAILGRADLPRVDAEMEWIRTAKWRLFAARGSEARQERPVPARPVARPRPDDSERAAGYLRIHSFSVGDDGVDAFLADVGRQLEDLRDRPLIIDVRANPGGSVLAADGVLQMICPEQVEPLPLEWPNTPAAREMSRRFVNALGVPDAARETFDAWKRAAVMSGAPFFPSLEHAAGPQRPARLPQVHQGPFALLVDALSYSAAELFAAGFERYGLGPIFGPGVTGGGGGNVWSYEFVRKYAASDLLRPLPHRASFDVAVRRTMRTGRWSGLGIEDVGVQPSVVAALTSADLLRSNETLREQAEKALEKLPRYRLEGKYGPGGRAVTFRATNTSYVALFVDGVPAGGSGRSEFELDLPAGGKPPSSVRLVGYDAAAADGSPRRPVVAWEWSR